MKPSPFFAAACAVLLAACVTTPAGPTSPSASAHMPTTALDLGDYQHASADNELSAFQETVSHRYGEGLQLSAVAADLNRYQFNCAPNADHGARGDPPAEICRRTVTVSGCTHTWQVHLYDTNGDALLTRTRGLYDRRCGNDGLLGGPS